jgi:signal transduction protein with GAF and PtsI domain
LLPNVTDLIGVIMSTARDLVNAERCTLFLVDHENEQLWSRVAQGSGEIRLPMGMGIAGHVACTGEILNIIDG